MNKYANLGGTKVIPVCPCDSATCPYPKVPLVSGTPSVKITHYKTWGMDHILLRDGSRIELPNNRSPR